MTQDSITERLRAVVSFHGTMQHGPLCKEAADEIDRLRAQIEQLCGDVRAVSADYTEAKRESERLSTRLREVLSRLEGAQVRMAELEQMVARAGDTDVR